MRSIGNDQKDYAILSISQISLLPRSFDPKFKSTSTNPGMDPVVRAFIRGIVTVGE